MKGGTGRRRFLGRAAALAGGLVLTGCDRLSRTGWFPPILERAEALTRTVQRLITPRNALAKEYTEKDLSPTFRSNGTAEPDDEEYAALAKDGFADWRLSVGGLVEHPLELSLAELQYDSNGQVISGNKDEPFYRFRKVGSR